jgi:L-lactate dehydrogenase (cytochrome)/(S)-mandelate dehydrogenase
MAATSVAPRWMQIFVYRDRGFTREFVDRAAACGFDALVLTTDTQLIVNRERDIRNGFTIPPRFSPLDVAAMAGKLPWLMRMGPRVSKISFANYASLGGKSDIGSLAAKLPGMLDPSMSWREVEWLRGLWKGPFLLKGIVHPKEATEAVARGIDGVIVSNHGGRQLNGMPSSLDALPGVLAAVRGRIPVLLDGGIRRGADVVKALALGVSLCLIARPHLFGLAVAGEAGVARVLDILRREIDRTMGLLGVSKLSELGPDYLMPRNAAPPPPATLEASA